MIETQTFDRDILQQIAAAVAAYIAPPIPLSIELWDKKKLGQYLVFSPSTVESYIAKPDFPKSICLDRGPRAPRRWKAKEVIEWAEARQEKRRDQ
jgi:hypothetical protein